MCFGCVLGSAIFNAVLLCSCNRITHAIRLLYVKDLALIARAISKERTACFILRKGQRGCAGSANMPSVIQGRST
jgi:hypothetical protein